MLSDAPLEGVGCDAIGRHSPLSHSAPGDQSYITAKSRHSDQRPLSWHPAQAIQARFSRAAANDPSIATARSQAVIFPSVAPGADYTRGEIPRRRTMVIQATLAAAESDPKTERRSTLLLVDGFGLIFRAFYALDKSVSSLANSAGEPTGAVYGFAAMLLDVLRNERPDYAIVALEGGRTFRHEAFTDYKANRGEMPEDLRRQLGRVREFIDALGVPVMIREGYEADDVIGSLATQCGKRDNVRVIVVTGDSDLLQLVTTTSR